MKSNNSVGRTQSIRYVGDDDELIIKFNSLERGGLDDDNDNHKNSNLFIYNAEKDVYRLNSIIKPEKNDSSKNLETIIEEEQKNRDNQKANEDKEEGFSGGNIIFASSLNFKENKLTPLYIILLCYLLFCLIELLCGYYSNSITLMADAAHYFSESSCFAIFILSIYVSRKRATNSMSFGFHRGEIIGILVRASFLLGFSFWLIYYISLSFIHPQIVSGLTIIIVGIISTFFNLIMGLVLMIVGISNDISFSEKKKMCQHQHSDDELNCSSAKKTFTNVIFKGIQSCIIILAGVLVYFLPSNNKIDPCCTSILTGILLYDSYKQMGAVITILMEGSPLEFDVEGLERDLSNIEGVEDIHDIHVWSLSVGKLSMSCHLTTSEPQISDVLSRARELIKKKYNITHSTIQVELNKNNKKKCRGNLH